MLMRTIDTTRNISKFKIPTLVIVTLLCLIPDKIFSQGCGLSGSPYVPPTAQYCPSEGGAKIMVQGAVIGYEYRLYGSSGLKSTIPYPASNFFEFPALCQAGSYEVRVYCGQEQTIGTCVVSEIQPPSGGSVTPSRSLSENFCDSNPGTLSFSAGSGFGHQWYIDGNPYSTGATLAYPFNHASYGIPGGHTVSVTYNVTYACGSAYP